jgi:hypothetical protein
VLIIFVNAYFLSHEGPNNVHIVGRSASDSKPAKFVVFLVKNQGVPAVLPAK